MPITVNPTIVDFRNQVRTYISSLTSDPDLIDELTQEVMLRMHERVSDLRNSEKLTSWLFTIARNVFIDHTRRMKRLIHNLPDGSDEEPNLVGESGTVAVANCIRALSQQLPSAQRTVFEHVEYNNLAQIDVARKFSIPYSTVKSRYQKARETIRQLILGQCFLQTDSFGNVLDYHIPEKK